MYDPYCEYDRDAMIEFAGDVTPLGMSTEFHKYLVRVAESTIDTDGFQDSREHENAVRRVILKLASDWKRHAEKWFGQGHELRLYNLTDSTRSELYNSLRDTVSGSTSDCSKYRVIRYDGESLSIGGGNTVVLPAGETTVEEIAETARSLLERKFQGWARQFEKENEMYDPEYFDRELMVEFAGDVTPLGMSSGFLKYLVREAESTIDTDGFQDSREHENAVRRVILDWVVDWERHAEKWFKQEHELRLYNVTDATRTELYNSLLGTLGGSTRDCPEYWVIQYDGESLSIGGGNTVVLFAEETTIEEIVEKSLELLERKFQGWARQFS